MRYLLALALLMACGCESIQKGFKHTQSGLVGLERRVTLYAVSGDTIRTWQGRFLVEVDSAPCASFITDDGREVKIAGTWIIEEIPR